MSLDLGNLADDLRRDEGLRLEIYRDSLGHATVGYGHLCVGDDLKYYADGVSEAQAESLLVEDISTACKSLDASLSWWRTLPDDAQRGLANQCFNLGIERLLEFKRMLAALASRDFADAATEALTSEWAIQVGQRAERIAALYFGCAAPVDRG